MKKMTTLAWMLGMLGVASTLWADPSMLRNPPVECGDGPGQTPCGCDTQSSEPQSEEEDVDRKNASSPPASEDPANACVQVSIPLGRASVMSDRRGISLRIYTSTASPALFTPEELRVVMGYSFNALGSGRSKKNVPSEVLFNQAKGEPIRFVFKEGESLGIPDPGVHIELNERVQMVDAEGWATAEDPAYYDLYPGDGSVWRFYATNITGRLGELVSYTDPRGRVITAADFGVDIVRGANGLLRQVLTPSRLADIVAEEATRYTVRVYPLRETPAFEDGRYVPPSDVTPVETLTVARGEDDRHLNVTVRKGSGDARVFRYVYVENDWTLTRPSGMVEEKSMRYGDDENALIGKIMRDAQGRILSRRKTYLTEAPWGGYMKHWTAEGMWEVGDVPDVARTNRWEYVMSGPAQGKVAKATAYTGKVTTTAYDEAARVIREAEGDGKTEWRVTTTSYASVAEGDRTSLRDTRPRCKVVTERDPESGEQVEVARTYWVYLPHQEIRECAAAAGAAYGAAGALRTVKTWYAPDDATPYCAGRLQSIRHENGRVERYTYALEGETWKKTVTFLHEQAPEPISGKTTRRNILYNRVGNIIERNTEAFIEGAWHLIDRTAYEYDLEGHVIKETDFAGRVTTTVWGGSCCGKSSMTLPNGTRFTYTYDDEGRLIAETKLDPLPCTTHFEYAPLGRVVKTWKDGLNPVLTEYDIFGQVISQTDIRGGVTKTDYSLDGNTVTTTFPNGGTQICKTDATGRLLEVFGTATQPQVFTYGPNWRKSATGARWQEIEHNLLGRTIRQTRSGANGSTLETLMAYDNYGRTSQISATGQPVQSFTYAATGEQTALTQTVGEMWRKQQGEAVYLLREGNVWQKQTAVQSCSDTTIAPLTQTAYVQVSGLPATNTFNQITVDIRGNETRTFGNETQRTIWLPSCTNPQVETCAFGQLIETVNTACVTNRFEYDALDRRVASIDGRNNRTTSAYDAKNNLVSTTDAVGAVTAYAYDVMGQTVAVTNALGNVTRYEYDLRGNKTYEGGATYPVRYAYDTFGNKISMTTYRNEAFGVGDITTWAYDEASGVLLSKTYADGKGLKYTYTNDGRLATRTNARGIVTTYAYDGWGQLRSVDYSDETPAISYVYDAMGRQTSATDAVGTTIFAYDAFGQLTAEQVSGLYSKTLTRHYDTFGRNVGYSVDDDRKQSLSYASATGRIVESDGFEWNYLANSNLKSKLTYPTGATACWDYESKRDLLTKVTNAHVDGTEISSYTYTNDLLGRRTSKNNERYGYNVRDELISADEVSYAYDDIGNRTTAEGKTYTANNLNQYTAIDDFTPQYDADGNQTFIKTSTGIWSVTYNAENRPIRWQSGDTAITMSFDRMGRRIEMRTVKNGTETLQRFVYDNYLCIQQLRTSSNTLFQSYVWDPTEPIATRPLVFLPASSSPAYYFHDGNKNVSDLVDVQGDIVHYPHTPFGIQTASASSENPYRFSSEVFDITLGLSYYNYRHYIAAQGRWSSRDLVHFTNLFLFSNNNTQSFDLLGLYPVSTLADLENFYAQNGAYGKATFEKPPFTMVSKITKQRMEQDSSCSSGCRVYIEGKIYAVYKENFSIKLEVPELTSEVNPGQRKRFEALVNYIKKHEEAHKADYEQFAKNLKENLPKPKSFSTSYCSNDTNEKEHALDTDFNAVEQSIWGEQIDDLNNKLHSRIGERLDISMALVAGVITVIYPDGKTEEVRLD